MKYRRKPQQVDAIQYSKNLADIINFAGATQADHDFLFNCVTLHLPTVDMLEVHTGEWLIKEASGNIYTVSDKNFKFWFEPDP